MKPAQAAAVWLRGRAAAFTNDADYLEKQRPPASDEAQGVWQASRDRLRAYKITSAELNTVADAMEREL